MVQTADAAYRLSDVRKVFPPDRNDRGGDPRPVLDGFGLQVMRGEFCALIGPSGAGKTTVLNLLAGLERADSGTVTVLGREHADLVGAAAYMPQRDALLPWRRIVDNVSLPLRLRGVPRAAARNRALKLLEQVGLDVYAGAWPSALSGGMRQRVAFLRTLAASREALLLDEPFGALDALTRAELQDFLTALVRRRTARHTMADLEPGAPGGPYSVLLVTHDVEEALYLSDRVIVMGGRPARIVLDLPLPWRDENRTRALTLEPRFLDHKRVVFEALGMAMGQSSPLPMAPQPRGRGAGSGTGLSVSEGGPC